MTPRASTGMDRGEPETSSTLMIPSREPRLTKQGPGLPRLPRWEPIASREYEHRSSSREQAEALAVLSAGPYAVLTGAGMSTASGLPDYRDKNARPRTPMTIQEFTASHESRMRYWARSFVGWPQFIRATPNAAHHALTLLQQRSQITTVITQNVDGLHRQAGTARVIDLHGTLDETVCLTCHALTSRRDLQDSLARMNPEFAARAHELAESARHAPDGDAEIDRITTFHYPDCSTCGGILKPNVVFFGENAPRERVELAYTGLAQADSLLVLGSSLSVQSGLRFVRRALASSTPVIVVSEGPTRADPLPITRIHARLETILPAWSEAMSAHPSPSLKDSHE